MITGFRNIRDVAFVLGCGIRNACRGDSDLTSQLDTTHSDYASAELGRNLGAKPQLKWARIGLS
jgi:hypothetical protein